MEKQTKREENFETYYRLRSNSVRMAALVERLAKKAATS